MAFQIRISPEALRAAAEREQEVCDITAKVRSQISSMVADLNEAWDGGASAQAINALELIHDSLRELVQGTNDAGSKLAGIANAFESLDNGETLPTLYSIRLDDRFIHITKPTHPDFFLSLKGQLRIIPDEVRVVANRCRKSAAELEESAARQRELLNTLEASWEGRAFSKFAEESHELAKGFLAIAENLAEMGDQLMKTATRYEELDSSL